MNNNESSIIFGVENYCTCKYYGEIDDVENHQWFLKFDKILIKNGFSFDHNLYDFEEIFNVEPDEKYYEVIYNNTIRYFKKLFIRPWFISDKYSLNKHFECVDDLIKSEKSFFFIIDCGDFDNIKNISLSEKIIRLTTYNKCIIVLNTSYEPFSMETTYFSLSLENFVKKYNLNKNNLKILSGNLLSTIYNNDRYEFIPYCYFLENPWFVKKDSFNFPKI